MRLSLDRNIVIALMAGSPEIRRKLSGYDVTDVGLSAVVVHELSYGAFNSEKVEANLARLARLAFPVIDVDARDAHAAGRIRATFRRAGTPIGPYDLLIAGQALARGLTVITANVGEFSRVEGLAVENWLTV